MSETSVSLSEDQQLPTHLVKATQTALQSYQIIEQNYFGV